MSKRATALTVAVVGLLLFLPSLAAPEAGKPKAATARPSATTQPKAPSLPKLGPMSNEPTVKLTPQQEAELLAAMKRSSPDDYYTYLIAAKKGDPKVYQRTLSWMWRKYERWRNAPKEIQEQMLVEQRAISEIGELVHAIRMAKDPADRDQLKKRLMDAVTRKFDAEIVLHDYRLIQFEQRLKKLRDNLAKRKADRDNKVKQQYELLLGETAPPPKKSP